VVLSGDGGCSVWVTAGGTAPLAAISVTTSLVRPAPSTGPSTAATDNGTYTSSFAGFAPCQQPADRDVVILQGTDKKDHFGGSAAGPVFKTSPPSRWEADMWP